MVLGTDDGSAWATFRQRYFNVDGFVNQTTLGFEDGEVGRYDLMDQAAVLKDYTVLLKGWQESGFSWVNKDDFIRYEYTNNFTHEVTTIEFTENQLPEPAPMETPPRYLTISKSTVVETSKNYNLGFHFDNRQMATEAGQHEFGLFSARITQMFIELVSRLSLVKLFQRSHVDEIYHNPTAGVTLIQQERLLQEEVLATFAGNHSEFGCLPAFLEAAKKMERTNPGGGLPTHVLYNAEKQMLLKFGVESEARGTNLLDTNDFIRMYEMDFRPVPIFSTSTNKSDLDVGSLLAAKMEIGNHFHVENRMLKFPRDKVCIAQQGRLSIFSENANGMQDVYWTEMNLADSRWDKDGRLTSNHEECSNMFSFYTGSSTPDHNTGAGFTACRVIGDMHADKLPREIIQGMVDMMLLPFDVAQLSDDLESIIQNTNANTPMDPGSVRRMTKFAARAMTVLGGTKNPLFRKTAAVDDDAAVDVAGESADKYALRRIMRDVFKCRLRSTFPLPGTLPVRRRMERGQAQLGRPVGNPGVARPAMGLSYGTTRDDNDLLDVDGCYGVADRAILEDIDRLLAGIEARVVEVDHTEGTTIARMRTQVGAYMRSPTSDLSGRDLKIVRNALQSMTNDIAQVHLYDADSTKSQQFHQLMENINLLEVLVTLLQRVGKNIGRLETEFFNKYEFATETVADTRKREIEAALDDLAGALPNTGFNWLAITPWDIITDPNHPTVTAAGTGYNTNEPAFHAAAPTLPNVFHGIIDFTDGSRRIKKGRTGNKSHQEDGGDTRNIWSTVARIQSMFYTEIERGVGCMLAVTPIHRDVFDSMLSHNVFIPCEYILVRNQMSYQTEGGCIVQGGSHGVGVAYLSHPAAEIGKSAMDMTGMVHVAQCVSIVIPDKKRRWNIPHLFYRRALGGANAKLHTRESWDKHVASTYYSRGYNRNSMTALSVPVGSHVAEELHVSGFKHEEENEPHYTEYRLYGKQLGYNKFSTTSTCLHERILSQEANGMCFMGTYATYGMDGKRDQGHENQGHHKIERVGVKAIRQRGVTIVSNAGTQMF